MKCSGDIPGCLPADRAAARTGTAPTWWPPGWVVFYLGSIVAANVAGSTVDTIAGVNIEHLCLGGALGFLAMFLLFEGNYRRVEGLSRVGKYLALFGLAWLLGLLSSVHPGPEIVGMNQLLYWCGLIVSIGVAAVAGLRGRTAWVLAAIALAGIPLMVSIFAPFLPFLAPMVPVARLQGWHQGRATGLFSNPNWTGFGLYCGLAACLCLYGFISRRLVRWVCLALSLLYAVAVFFTVSRASILITLLTGGVFLYTLWRRAAHRWAVALVAIALAGVGLQRMSLDFDWQALSFSRMFDRNTYEGDSFRLHGLRNVARDGGRNLFLGEGTGQFVEESHIYLRGVSLPKIRTYDKAPHNQILAVWVEWGLLALLLMYSAHAWVICRGFAGGRRCVTDTGFMLLTTYVSILLYLQLHGTNSPASCALLGLGAACAFKRGPGDGGLHLTGRQP